ncbi:Phenylacetic acid catabolic protein [Sulfolobus tengchongensis]|uniref:Phenylacetic acid catabolic protein n=1 Tax=Sulfolobus tengchongensis TaxID=207809 RepID=A0AAX4KZP4_9CREN
MRKISSVKEVPQDLRKAIIDIIELRADFELGMVEQYSPWLVNAPTVDGRLFIAKLVSDELNHSWQLLRILEEFNAKDSIERIQNARLGIHKLEVSNLPLFNWEDVISFTFLVDRAGLHQLRVLKNSSFEPLSNLASTMIKEEEAHLFFSQNELKNYQNKSKMQAAINFWFPRAVEMLYGFRSINEIYLNDLNISELVKDDLINDYIKMTNEELKRLGYNEVNPTKSIHYNVVTK